MATVLPADKFDATMTFERPASPPSRVMLDKLAPLPGFNTRVKDAEYSERVAMIAASIAANGFYEDKPLSVVMIPNDDTVYFYDGEHRYDAARAATLDGAEFPDGIPVAWAKDGVTVKDLTVHLVQGNAGAALNQVELAAVVRRLKALGLEKDQIATEIGKSARHVDNLLVLAGANQTVKQAVATGKFAAAEAVKLLRKDPKSAGDTIKAAVKAAEEKGKAKATPKTMQEPKPAGPRMKVETLSLDVPVGAKMGEVLKSLAGQIRQHVKVDSKDVVTEIASMNVRLHVVDAEAEAARAKREEEKAAAAKAREEAKAKTAAEKKPAAAKKTTAAAAPKKGDSKPVAKGGSTAKTPAQAKEAAKAHLGGDKAATATKAAEAAQTPAESDSKAPGTSGAPEAGSTPQTPIPGETDGNNGL